MQTNRNETDLTRLFEPRSVAHVGASAKPAAGRFPFAEYLVNMGFAGKVFPVNPKYEEVSELTCYPSLAAIPGRVDLAILAVPAPKCVEVLREAPADKPAEPLRRSRYQAAVHGGDDTTAKPPPRKTLGSRFRPARGRRRL